MTQEQSTTFMALADDLIPAHDSMPAFSQVCTFDETLAALDFRTDLKEGFSRALATDLQEGATAYLDRIVQKDPEAFEAFLAVDGRDLRNHVRHMIFCSGVIHLARRIGHAIFRAVPLPIGRFARSNQRLRRHATKVQAVAAHLVPFKQHNIRPHL